MTTITGVSSLLNAAAASSGSSSTSTTSSTDQLGENTFLKLLVAQLKYQDPEQPADATQFLSQTAQFTMVQKIDALATLDQKVLDATTSQAATALVGRTVTWTDVSGTSHTGTVTGTTLGSSTPNLTIDGKTVSFTDVTGVTTTPTSAST